MRSLRGIETGLVAGGGRMCVVPNNSCHPRGPFQCTWCGRDSSITTLHSILCFCDAMKNINRSSLSSFPHENVEP